MPLELETGERSTTMGPKLAWWGVAVLGAVTCWVVVGGVPLGVDNRAVAGTVWLFV